VLGVASLPDGVMKSDSGRGINLCASMAYAIFLLDFMRLHCGGFLPLTLALLQKLA
jgi:hypothetical protein